MNINLLVACSSYTFVGLLVSWALMCWMVFRICSTLQYIKDLIHLASWNIFCNFTTCIYCFFSSVYPLCHKPCKISLAISSPTASLKSLGFAILQFITIPFDVLPFSNLGYLSFYVQNMVKNTISASSQFHLLHCSYKKMSVL